MVRETSRTCNSWLWGPPSSVSSCGEGEVKENLPCKQISQENQRVQNGFQKLGHKSESKARGQGSGLGELRIPRGVGTFGLQSVGCAWGLARVMEGPRTSISPGPVKASIISREWVSPCSLGQRTTSLRGILLLKGLPHSPEAEGPRLEGPPLA